MEGPEVEGEVTTVADATIAVKEIHCASCEKAIRVALSRLDGVRAVKPDAARNDVRVHYDEAKVDEARLRQALAEVGYDPVD
jgi:copper chaperone CopZ